MSPAAVETPLHVFRFRVEFFTSAEDGGAGGGGTGGGEPVPLCDAAFAECSGLEATMEAKTINVGGRNFGPVQRAGRTSFATVILKRGVTHSTHLWQWFELVSGGAYAYRLDAEISLLPNHGDAAALTWRLTRALPTKFKAADLNASAGEVGVEELHFMHEGLRLQRGGAS